MTLEQWGWNSHFARFSAEASGVEPGRIITGSRGQFTAATAGGERIATPSGKLLYAAELPVVGDWVWLRGPSIEGVLPRRTALERRRPGGEVAQVLASNVDVLFVVSGLDGDFNLRRLERYLVLAAGSGADPVIVLNKADLCPEAGPLGKVRAIAGGAPVLWVSAQTGEGVGGMDELLGRGRTGALIGSSGAGKSTLLNRLLGCEAQATQPVREGDSRGRHTTARRELIRLPSGALLMDLPGLREVGVWADADSLGEAFGDVATLAAGCRFRDCRHQGEPGCAVAGAVDDQRLASYQKLQREVEWVERRGDLAAESAHRKRWRAIHKAMRNFEKGGNP